MTRDEFMAHCAKLPHTTHVIQWRGADVWKIGGKVFVIARCEDEQLTQASFKVSPMSFDIMKEQPGLRPVPHLASRGMLWIQWYSNETLSDDDLKSYLDSSHRLVASGLTKKKQRELGFLRD